MGSMNAGLQKWITSALNDEDCRESVILACGLSGHIANEVIGAAQCATSSAAQARALLWAADAVIESAQPSGEALTLLMSELANAASQAGADECAAAEPSRQRGSRPGWPYVLRLAMLPLPAALRPPRGQLIEGLATGDYEQVLGATLAALADARADSSDVLKPGQVTSVMVLLTRSLPERALSSAGQSARPGRYMVSKKSILPGHQEAAQQAARYAAQLGKEAADGIYRIAFHGWFQDYARVSNRLSSLGFEEPKETRTIPDLRIAEMFSGISGMGGVREIWLKLFAVAASLVPQRALSDGERWRYPGLAALANALLAEEGTIVGVNYAIEREQRTLGDCMVAACHAVGLDIQGISAEASHALEAWPSCNRDVIAIIFAPPSTHLEMDAMHLDSQDKDALIEALGAGSDWLANIACNYLLESRDPRIGERAATRVQEIAANRRGRAVMVAIANDPNPADATSRFLDSSDPPVRVGAAAATQMLAQAEAVGAWTALINRALNDEDKTVRLAAGADSASVGQDSYWSCDECGQTNRMNARHCGTCGEEAYLRIVMRREDLSEAEDGRPAG